MSISPNIPSPHESYAYDSAGTPRWIAVLFGLVIAGLAVVVYFGYTMEARLSQDLARQQDQNKILSAQLDQANSRIADLKSHVEITTQRMGLTQSELAKAKSRAEDIRKEQQASDQELVSQIKASQEQIYLNRTDPKKSKYTITVIADDKTIEKKDRTAGEPVQFYVKGSSRMAPYEIVVFDVGKNQITGYLATPKDSGAPAPAAAPAPSASAAPATPATDKP